MLPSALPRLTTDSAVSVSWCLETSLFLRLPSWDGAPSLPLLSLFLSFIFFPTSFWRLWAAFLGALCPLPAFRCCFAEFTQSLNVLLMNLWGRKWSPHPIPLPSWDRPPAPSLGTNFMISILASPHVQRNTKSLHGDIRSSWLTKKAVCKMSISWYWTLPSPKPYMLTFPHCHFGAVSQSYLRSCLLGCSPHFSPNKTKLATLKLYFFFSQHKHILKRSDFRSILTILG